MANRYWVGGSGNWSDDTNHWSTTDGGSGGAGNKPTSADNVIFNGNSAGASYTVTVDETANCLDFTASAPASGNLTLGGTSTALNVFGSLTLYEGMLWTKSGSCNMTATSTGKTLTFAAVAMVNSLNFTGVGGGWTLNDDFNSSGPQFGHTAGTLDLNDKNVTCGTFSISGSGTKTLSLGTGTINCNSFNNSGSNLTLNEETSLIQVRSVNGFTGNGETYYDVETPHPATTSQSEPTITGANTFHNLTITGDGTTSGPGAIILTADQTVTGTFTCNGLDATTRKRIYSNAKGTQRTITAATVSISNVDFQDFVGAGAGSWSGTSIANGGNNSGITFTGAVTRYWVGNGGSWSSTARWSTSDGGGSGASVPLIHDTAIFTANSITSGSQTVTFDRNICSVDFSAVANNPTIAWNTNNRSAFGHIVLKSGMSSTAVNPINLRGVGSFNLDTQSVQISSSTTNIFHIRHPQGVYTLLSNFTTNGGFRLQAGSLDLNDFDLTANLFDASFSSEVRTVSMGSGTMTLTGTGTVLSFGGSASNLTFNRETSTIKLTSNSATAKTVVGSDVTYWNFWNATAGTGTLTISGSNTFNDFKIDAGRTVIFTAGTTQVVTSFTAVGGSGTEITLQSTTTTNFTLSKSSGVVSCNYLIISDSTATGGASWYAGKDSTDNGGGNSGWIFGSPSAAINKSLKYTVAKSVAVTKSLKYTIRKSNAITKSLEYAINSTSTQTIQKTLKYTVRRTPSALTKSLKYTVRTTPAAATKSLQYAVRKAIAPSKSLKYAVVTTPSPKTKSLKYTIQTTTAPTKALIYDLRDRIYTRAEEETLGLDDTNLATQYVNQDYADVADDDETYVNQEAATADSFAVHLYKYRHTSVANLQITWNGKTSKECSVSTVYLQVYNRTTEEWENVDSDSTTGSDTDFNLSGTLPGTPSDYFDAETTVAVRIYQQLV